MTRRQIQIPNEVARLAVEEFGAPADIGDYRWWQLDSPDDRFDLAGPTRTITVDRTLSWRGITVHIGWSEVDGVGCFAFS